MGTYQNDEQQQRQRRYDDARNRDKHPQLQQLRQIGSLLFHWPAQASKYGRCGGFAPQCGTRAVCDADLLSDVAAGLTFRCPP